MSILFLLLSTTSALAIAQNRAEDCIRRAKPFNDMQIKFSYCNLENNDIPQIISFLKEHPSFREVDLSANHITADGAKLLANVAIWRLFLDGNAIGDTGATYLAEKSAMTWLDLSSTDIGAEGAKALAKNEALSNLNLAHNHISDEGAIAFRKKVNQSIFLMLMIIISVQMAQLAWRKINNSAI